MLVDEENFFNWNLIMDGPPGSPYEGGKFTVNINCEDSYPNKCPKIKIITKIYHCNVKTDTGEICA